jgi:hypothetical protein
LSLPIKEIDKFQGQHTLLILAETYCVMPEHSIQPASTQADTYRIVLEGHLSRPWLDWFDGFAFTLDERGRTTLVGPVIDQAALHGLLDRIGELGIPLISINRLDPVDPSVDLR